MTPQERLIATAVNEVGYIGHRSNAQLDTPTANGGGKYNKYARDLDALWDFYNGPKNGFDWCFPAGTLVLTDGGYKPIEDINVGDRVMGALGDRFNEVTHVGSHIDQIYSLSAYGTVTTFATGNHPYLSRQRISKYRRSDWLTAYDFRPLESLQKNDMLCMPKTPEVECSGLSVAELWAVGYYVGDGYKYRTHYILCGNDEKIEAVSQHISIVPESREYKSRTCRQVKIDMDKHPRMAELLDDCGNTALHKRVPRKVLFGSLEDKAAFLAGYLCADGFFSYQQKGFTTVSTELAVGMSRIAFDLGLGCSIVTAKRPTEGFIFDMRTGKFRKFNQQEIIYACKINENQNMKNHRHIFDGNFTLVPAKEIVNTGSKDTVYTLTTDGDHTYTANNLGVHNCDCFVDWCFVKTFGRELAQKLTFQPNRSCGAGTAYSLGYYRNNGHFSSTPQVGDQIFFGDSKSTWHTGIVTRVTGGTVTTVEGNAGSPMGVHEFSYKIGYKNIKGYGRPDWALLGATVNVPSAAAPSAAAPKIGDIVEFTGSQHFTSSSGNTSFPCKAGSARVTQIANGARHPYHLIHTGAGCTVYGWVDAGDIKG